MRCKLSIFDSKPRESADEWAERVVKLDGLPYSYAKRPFMKLPTRCMSDLNNCFRVVLECSAQLSKSTALINFLGWIYNHDPANVLFVMDSMSSCNKITKNRLRPFLREQAGVQSLKRGVILPDKSSSAVNISFGVGRNLMIGSARSPSDLCSFPAKYIIADETARFPVEVGTEGDPVFLLAKRQLTFKGMFVMASTPTTEECSIHQNYLQGTQEEWCAVCHCGEYMPVRFRDIDWTNNVPTYACKACGEVYTEDGIRALIHSFSPPQNAEPLRDKFGRVCRSFHVSAPLAHDCYTWEAIRREELESLYRGASAYRSFVNTTLGEPYTARDEIELNPDSLGNMRTQFTRETLPEWVRVVCIGADTQAGTNDRMQGVSSTRIEYLVCGADEYGRRIAFIERGAIYGDLNTPEPWRRWREFLTTTKYKTVDGRSIVPALTCQDAGGGMYYKVLEFAQSMKRVRAVKGYAAARPSDCERYVKSDRFVNLKINGINAGRAPLATVNTVRAKDTIRAQMLAVQNNAKGAPWVISSDIGANFDADFFRQIDSERRDVNASGVVHWYLLPGARNEMLDCCVYCLAAFELVQQWTRKQTDIGWTEQRAEAEPLPFMESMTATAEAEPEALPAERVAVVENKSRARKRRRL